jgi:hypothetical protein
MLRRTCRHLSVLSFDHDVALLLQDPVQAVDELLRLARPNELLAYLDTSVSDLPDGPPLPSLFL